MTRREMEENFRKIVKKDTKLDAQEQAALLDQFVELHYRADIGFTNDTLYEQINRVMGVIEYLNAMGKIRDEEDLCMLINGIEAFAYQVAEDPKKSSWGPKEPVEV